jgi:myb proto-oncogene protein
MDLAKAPDIPLKRRGGRTSRRAMKKNKKYFQKDVTVSTTPSPTEAIPLPPTPAIDDCMVLDPDTNDKERESQMLCLSDHKETETLGPFALQEGIDGGLLCFDDIVDNGLLEYGVLTLKEGRESNDVVMGFSEDRDRDSGFTRTNKEISATGDGHGGEWYCSSKTSGFDYGVDNWGWEQGVIQGNEISWDEKEESLSLLWESDNLEGDSYQFGEIDFNKQDAILAWLLS